MNDDLDSQLQAGLLIPPEDFSQQVMQRIACLPLPVRRPRWLDRLQWIALVGGGIAGATQLAAFVFGIWAVTSAG
jgi:hypothetical protein